MGRSFADHILDIDPDFATLLDQAREKLPPLQIGKYGQIQERQEDFEEPEPGHQISSNKTPLFAQAAMKTLERRLQFGGGHTGWSQAWIINLWARLKKGEKGLEHLTAL